MKQFLKDFLDHLRLNRNASGHTVTAYGNDVTQFLTFTAHSQGKQVDALRPEDCDEVRLENLPASDLAQ